MYNKEKERLFVDMDGTLAVFQPVDTMETLYEKGYFANLTPHQNVIDGMKAFLAEHQDIEVYVLSSVLSDSPYALEEKQAWLDRYFPEIDQEHRIFSPCGQPKAAYVPGGIRNTDMLLDDYSDNLHDWEPPGMGIKLMNGINGTKGTWKGKRIRYDLDPSVFSSALYLSIIDRQKLRQELIQSHEEYQNNEEDLTYAEAGITELRAQEDAQAVSSDAGETRHAGASSLYQRVSGEGVRFREGREVNTRGKLSERYIKDGQVSLIGAKAENARELARLLQCYRNPMFETARGFYLKDGYIISAEAVSSRLPGITVWKTEDGKPFSEHVNEKMKCLQADEFYMVHNHPTGDPTPSMQDQMATWIEGANISRFAGHIVLDHTTYALIDKSSNYTIEEVPEVTGSDMLLTASIPHPLLGEEVKGTESIARIGRMLLDDNAENFSFAAYIGSAGRVREIQEISNEIIGDTKEFRAFVQQEMMGSGSNHAALYTTDENIYENIIPMIEEGYFMDVLFIDTDYGMYWSQRDLGTRKKEDYLFAGLKEKDLQFTYQEEGLNTAREYEFLKNVNVINEFLSVSMNADIEQRIAWTKRRIATEGYHLTKIGHGEEPVPDVRNEIPDYLPLTVIKQFEPKRRFADLSEEEQNEIRDALSDKRFYYDALEEELKSSLEEFQKNALDEEALQAIQSQAAWDMMQLNSRKESLSETQGKLEESNLKELTDVLLLSDEPWVKAGDFANQLMPEKEIVHRNQEEYLVIERRDTPENGLQDLLLLREEDGEVVYAHGWDTESGTWAYGQYHGVDLRALKAGAGKFFADQGIQPEQKEMAYQVYVKFGNYMYRDIAAFETEAEAFAFCEAHDWIWEDKNGWFTWDLNYAKIKDENQTDKEYPVYLESGGGIRKLFATFGTEREAADFCASHDWEWTDENQFVWNMDYEEVETEPENRNEFQNIQEQIVVDGHAGTWHIIDTAERATPYDMGGVATYFLLEHDTFGEDAACVIINGEGKLVIDDVYNGFGDLDEAIDGFNDMLVEMERIGYRVLDVKDNLSCTLEGKDGAEHDFENYDALLNAEPDLSMWMREWKLEHEIEASDVTEIQCTGTESFPHLREKVSTFDCKILGEHESMVYALSGHDNGEESFHIYTENLNIWKKMTVRELEKLESILSKEVSFYEWNQEIQKANSLKELRDVSYGMDETENLNLTHEQRRKLDEEILRREKEDFSDHIIIRGLECIKVDEWSDGKVQYILGRDLLQQEEENFHHVLVNPSGDAIQYDERPAREKVESDFLDLEAMHVIDQKEAESGADRWQGYPYYIEEMKNSATIRTYRNLTDHLEESEAYANELKERMKGLSPNDTDYQALKFELVYSAEPQLSKAQKAKEDFLKENPGFQLPPEGVYSENPALDSLVKRIDWFVKDFDPYRYDEDLKDSYCRMTARAIEVGDVESLLFELTEKRDMLMDAAACQKEELREVHELIDDVVHFGQYQAAFFSDAQKETQKASKVEEELE